VGRPADGARAAVLRRARAALGCAGYHLWLIRDRDREACFRAFLHNHWFGFAVFAGTALDYAVRARAWPRLA
jgi:4-hydroxybenzoate polyprenyltransferase